VGAASCWRTRNGDVRGTLAVFELWRIGGIARVMAYITPLAMVTKWFPTKGALNDL